MRVGLVQFSPLWESKASTKEKINNLVSVLEPKTDLLVFPEMTLTGFTMNSKQNAEEIDGQSIKYFSNLAEKLKVDVIAGIIEKEKKEYYNSLFHFNSLGIITAVYRKIHPFSLAEEDRSYSSGTDTVISRWDNFKIGLSICYDLRFPELYRFYAKEKVDLLINIANWPVKRIEHWKHLLKARAIENQCFMVGVNRVGNDPYQTYNGQSAVFSPMGEEIVININDEKIIYVDIDFEQLKNVREKLNFLNDIKMI